MEESFNQAWLLLGVGMLTVFSVLLLVVLLGNGIILFVNRFFPVSDKEKAGQNDTGQMNSRKMAVIVAAVKKVTKGRADVISINKK